MRSSTAYAAYSRNNVSIESPEKLIEMLYEGLLKFTSQAIRAIEDNDIEKKTYWINRSIAIFSELINSLDYSSGDVANYLDGLYKYQINLLVRASIENDVKKLQEVLNVTRGLLEAWREQTCL